MIKKIIISSVVSAVLAGTLCAEGFVDNVTKVATNPKSGKVYATINYGIAAVTATTNYNGYNSYERGYAGYSLGGALGTQIDKVRGSVHLDYTDATYASYGVKIIQTTAHLDYMYNKNYFIGARLGFGRLSNNGVSDTGLTYGIGFGYIYEIDKNLSLEANYSFQKASFNNFSNLYNYTIGLNLSI